MADALCAACHDVPVVRGTVASCDGFYTQMTDLLGDVPAELVARWDAAGVIGLDMETSALASVAAALGVRFGSLCLATVDVNGPVMLEAPAREAGEARLMGAALGVATTEAAAARRHEERRTTVTTVVNRYVEALTAQLQRIVEHQADAVDAAAMACADSIEGDGLVFSFGTGHGGFAALEMFPRTGTIAGFRPIVELPIALMHHIFGDMGTHQYRFLHKQEGYGLAILRAHRLATWRHDDPVLAVGPQRRDPRHRRREQAPRSDRGRRHVGPALQQRRVAPLLRSSAVRGRRRRDRHRRSQGRCRSGARGHGRACSDRRRRPWPSPSPTASSPGRRRCSSAAATRRR